MDDFISQTPIFEKENEIETIYSELNFWVNASTTDLVKARYERMTAHRLVQIRSESNSCILSKTKMVQDFPWIEPKCSNIIEVN